MEENVLRGVALLDEKVPDWQNCIYEPTFYMGSCKRCVLGNLFTSFSQGLEELGLNEDKTLASFYGFETNGLINWDELTQLWKEQL